MNSNYNQIFLVVCTPICTRKVLKSFEIFLCGWLRNHNIWNNVKRVKWSFRNCKKSLEQSKPSMTVFERGFVFGTTSVRYNQRIRSFSPRSILSKHTFPNYPPGLTRPERMKPRIISSLPVCRCMHEVIIQIAILFNFKKLSRVSGQKLLWLEFSSFAAYPIYR